MSISPPPTILQVELGELKDWYDWNIIQNVCWNDANTSDLDITKYD